MIIRKAKSNNIPYQEIDVKLIEQVSKFKILGLQPSNNLYWNCSVDFVIRRLQNCIFSNSSNVLAYQHYCNKTSNSTHICMYACTVCNHNLTSASSDQLKSYQKTVLRIIYSHKIKEMPDHNTLFSGYSRTKIYQFAELRTYKLSK